MNMVVEFRKGGKAMTGRMKRIAVDRQQWWDWSASASGR